MSDQNEQTTEELFLIQIEDLRKLVAFAEGVCNNYLKNLAHNLLDRNNRIKDSLDKEMRDE
jgi:hypothetical protein